MPNPNAAVTAARANTPTIVVRPGFALATNTQTHPTAKATPTPHTSETRPTATRASTPPYTRCR